MKTLYTIPQLAALRKVTRQSLYCAINCGRLKASRVGRFWFVSKEDYYDFYMNLYSRKISSFDGERIYSDKKGVISVKEAAELTGIVEQKIYYAIRSGKLLGERVGPSYVIKMKDLRAYSRDFLKKTLKKRVS